MPMLDHTYQLILEIYHLEIYQLLAVYQQLAMCRLEIYQYLVQQPPGIYQLLEQYQLEM